VAEGCGGETGIRTLGTLLRYNTLAGCRFRPLSNLSKLLLSVTVYLRVSYVSIDKINICGN
jgi:hypothetical protein